MTDIAANRTPAEPSGETAPRLVKMRRFGMREGSTVPISLVSGAAILAAWWIVAELRLVPHLFLPTPAEVGAAAVSIFQDGYANATLFQHVGASLLRIFSAAAIAIALGIPIGLFMGLNKWAKGVFDTPIEFYWPLPPLAYLPLMIIWLGIGETSKIALLALATDPAILLMDEPFGALDSLTREQMQELLVDVWDRTKKQIFFITHSIEEALFLGTHLVVMSPRPGRIVARYDLDFVRSFAATRDARSVKNTPAFATLQDDIRSIVHETQALRTAAQ